MEPENKRYPEKLCGNFRRNAKNFPARNFLLRVVARSRLLFGSGEPCPLATTRSCSNYHKAFLLTLISLALIIVLGVLVYANSLNGEFVWDDESLVEKNIYIRSISHVGDIFTRDISGYGKASRSYRPIQMLTYMFDYSLWKLDVRGYHITNIILHILTALSIYWFINLLYDNRLLSLFTSALFVTHPIHTEAVTYISGRADPLAGLFMILCLILYIKHIRLDKISLLILSLLSYTLALLSRENTIILPALILLYHFSFKVRLKPKSFIPILAIASLYIVVRLTALRYLLPHISSQTTILERIPGVFVAITDYSRLLLSPFGLHMEYTNKIFDLMNPKAIAGVVIFVSLFIYAIRNRSRNTLEFFCISWFFLALLPSVNIYPVNAYMAEHWLYIPSIGFFLLLANGLNKLYRKPRLKALSLIIGAAILVFYSAVTIRQNTYWRRPLTFYERTLKYVPDSARLYNNLAFLLHNMSRAGESIPLLEKAVAIDPVYATGYYNLGNSYFTVGRYQEAEAVYRKAIEINPRYGDAYNNLGNLYFALGKNQAAIDAYSKAVEYSPDNAVCYYNLANVYLSQNKFDDAIGLYEKAIGLRPTYADAYNNLGNAYSRSGHAEEAIASYKRAIEINPGLTSAYKNMELTYNIYNMARETKE